MQFNSYQQKIDESDDTIVIALQLWNSVTIWNQLFCIPKTAADWQAVFNVVCCRLQPTVLVLIFFSAFSAAADKWHFIIFRLWYWSDSQHLMFTDSVLSLILNYFKNFISILYLLYRIFLCKTAFRFTTFYIWCLCAYCSTDILRILLHDDDDDDDDDDYVMMMMNWTYKSRNWVIASNAATWTSLRSFPTRLRCLSRLSPANTRLDTDWIWLCDNCRLLSDVRISNAQLSSSKVHDNSLMLRSLCVQHHDQLKKWTSKQWWRGHRARWAITPDLEAARGLQVLHQRKVVQQAVQFLFLAGAWMFLNFQYWQ